MKKLDFPDYLELFFSKYVFLQRGLSPNTVSSYSDSLLLFYRYCEEAKEMRPDKVTIDLISKDLIVGFCEWLETVQHSSIATRNQRLTAIHALFRYIQCESPAHIALCRDILSIRMKKYRQEPPHYLSVEAIKVILSVPNANTIEGIRDLSILSLLYDSAIRVQELIDLKIGDVTLIRPSVIHVYGKGNKQRLVPIDPASAKIVSLYMKKYSLINKEQFLFTNRSGHQLTRVGITYILNKYVSAVKQTNPDLITIAVTPHILRHSKSAHLLSAGVNLIYIRDLLGHASVTTTEIYATSNPEFLRKAIENVSASMSPDIQTNVAMKRELTEFLKHYRV